ncbi:MAG: hypothetical protein ACRENG_17610, partial [bacterium]
LKKEKYTQAREVYQDILKLEPANKNAARGLERAEKGLQSREAKPSQITLLEPIDRTPTLFRGKSKLSGKRLWLGMAAVVLIGVVVGAWFLWFRPNSPIPPGPGGTQPDFSQKATAAKEEMLKAKTEAEQASAERWAPETYQQALKEEQRGNDEFSQGNFASAWRAYNAAMEKFGSSTEEGRSNTEAASLNEIKEEAAKEGQAMLKEKKQAEAVGAKTKARELFDKAIEKAEEGRKSFDRGDRDGYFAAQKFYAEARDGFRKAGEEAAFAKLADEAGAAKKEMDAAKQQIPGSEEEKNANSNYKDALKLETAGEQHFEAGDFRGAVSSFKQARDFYAAATNDMARNMGRSGADAAKAAMLAAHAKVGKESYAEAKYSEAERFRAEADNDYKGSNFDSAVKKYEVAEALYVAVARGAEEKSTREKNQRETAQQEIQNLVAAYKDALESYNISAFRSLFKSFDEKLWAGFFRDAENLKVDITIENIELAGNNAKVESKIRMQYYNKSINRSDDTTFPYTWTLERINGAWMIAKLILRR